MRFYAFQSKSSQYIEIHSAFIDKALPIVVIMTNVMEPITVPLMLDLVPLVPAALMNTRPQTQQKLLYCKALHCHRSPGKSQ